MLPSEIRDVARVQSVTDPKNAEAQRALLDRIRALRDLMTQGGQTDLAAYLEAAGFATECLVRPGGSLHERVASVATKLLQRVETAFGSAKPKPAVRVLTPDPASIDLCMVHDQPLGEILVQRGMVTREQVDEALRAQRATGMRLGEVLVMLGAATWDTVHHAVRLQQKMRDTAKT